MRLMGTTARAARPRVCMGRRSRPIHQPAEHTGGAVSGGTGLGRTVGRKVIGVIQKHHRVTERRARAVRLAASVAGKRPRPDPIGFAASRYVAGRPHGKPEIWLSGCAVGLLCLACCVV